MKKGKKSFIYLELKGLKESKMEVVFSKGDRFITFLEAVVRKCSIKKVLLEISQSLQENTCNQRTPFIIEHLWWLLLYF